MRSKPWFHNHVVATRLRSGVARKTRWGAALALVAALSGPALAADPEKLDDYFTRIAAAKDAGEAGRIEAELLIEWKKSGSPSIDMLFKRGEAALEAGNILGAIEHLTAALDHDPNFLAARDSRASAYFAAGEIGPAVADFSAVLTAEPRYYGALAGLAIILEETGKPAQALAVYRRIDEMRPFQPQLKDAISRLEKEIEGREL